MAEGVRIEEMAGPGELPQSAGTSALEVAGAPTVLLCFRIAGPDPESLEAIRHARRSILREDRTKGRDSDEASLEDAVFSPREIVWTVRPEQRAWCLEKLENLAARANRCLAEMRRC